ncbi:hypothetical protein SCP_0300650 [Sparassis crispa]|uniref:Uncharacterized protein n=1 Tax=Sparassis crispa TaxID=139825 RepID=A0A401GDV3_9APHY|nr:hypothetical protein SCP_0300650 [Sparassis crispa]GBE80350.1 hypothetical protein SCP_0300650 [Sparassis crispa]
MISLVGGHLLSLSFESVALGVHTLTLRHCLRPSRWERSGSPKRKNWTILLVALILYALGVVDVVLNIYYNLDAFVFHSGSGGAEAVFTDISNPVNCMRTTCLMMATLVADGMLVYRCWVIFGQVYYMATLLPGASLVAAPELQVFISAFGALNITLNMGTTVLIVCYIWFVHQQSAQLLQRETSGMIGLKAIMRIFVESALVYTTVVVIAYIADLTGCNIVYAMGDIELEMAGISFDLLIIRCREIACRNAAVDEDILTTLRIQSPKDTTSDHNTGIPVEEAASTVNLSTPSTSMQV